MARDFRLARRVITISAIVLAMTAAPQASFAADTGIDFEDHFVKATNTGKQEVSGEQEQLPGVTARDTEPAAVAVLSPEDGIDIIYERACTAGVGSDLNPATCPTMNAQCDAREGGVLVNWIEVNNNAQPATETPTGRSSCMYPGEPPMPPVEGADATEEAPIVITLEEFQKQPVVAATIVSQPLNFGLRNAHSNVYAEAQEQEFTFEFQDATIVLKARPVSYQWSYGDGTSATTATPGGPVEGNTFDTRTATSHQYAQTGDFNLTLTTFFAGDYSVDGGPFQPVAGEAAVQSQPHLMSIWRTRGHNVSENCIENPTGIGCEAPIR
ncbi:PKD domain-containing protein [Arthrobacter sp. B1805]|uniref:PKD domain-containing protein n=1 Tax=Arthrobacter sp. B1805 TaxID=2058892 RepID=UPI0011B091F5|nr:PKD domain-containing protein [Arthrobacter sp. B1805]